MNILRELLLNLLLENKSENLRPLDLDKERKNLIQTQLTKKSDFVGSPRECCGSLKCSLDNDNVCFKIPSERISNASRRLTDGHDPNTCDMCQIYRGQSYPLWN